jgi:hypothetical protein
MCESIAQFMDYHSHNKSGYGFLQMSADGYAFRKIEGKWTDFKDKTCNIGISLVSNSVDPLKELMYIYSVWPIFVINNNIPPSLSIKRENIMLTMIVLGIFLHQFFECNIFICFIF